MLCGFFAVKNLPFTDTFARPYFTGYDIVTTDKETFEEVKIMRHVYFRGIISLIWLTAAVVCGIAGNIEMAVLYVVLGGIFLYSAYSTWRKSGKGGR